MNNFSYRTLILVSLLLFSVIWLEDTLAQSDDLVLEWEQHWETFGKGGTCNYGTSNFYVGDIDNDEIVELVTKELDVSPELSYTGGERGWAGDVPVMLLDVKKLEALGWKPKVSFKEGVKRYINWIESQS